MNERDAVREASRTIENFSSPTNRSQGPGGQAYDLAPNRFEKRHAERSGFTRWLFAGLAMSTVLGFWFLFRTSDRT